MRKKQYQVQVQYCIVFEFVFVLHRKEEQEDICRFLVDVIVLLKIILHEDASVFSHHNTFSLFLSFEMKNAFSN